MPCSASACELLNPDNQPCAKVLKYTVVSDTDVKLCSTYLEQVAKQPPPKVTSRRLVARRFSLSACSPSTLIPVPVRPSAAPSTISLPCHPNFSHSPYLPPCCSCPPALSQPAEWAPNHHHGLTPRPKPNVATTVTQSSSPPLHTVRRQIRFAMPSRTKQSPAPVSSMAPFDVICPRWSSIQTCA